MSDVIEAVGTKNGPRITIIERDPVVEDGITYDVEEWLFDCGKTGTGKIVKMRPRPGSEAVRKANREEIKRALQPMHLCALAAGEEARAAAHEWAKAKLEAVSTATVYRSSDVVGA